MNGVIQVDDPRADDVRTLLAAHLAFAHEHSPPEDVHALDADRLVDPAVTFYSYREEGRLLGVGALRWLDREHMEIKSMHTEMAARGRGVGRAMLDHLIEVARASGVRRISLETGTPPAFEPARLLYASAGFAPCEPFGPYRASAYSVCMTLIV
jgi:putative acetyltransferase